MYQGALDDTPTCHPPICQIVPPYVLRSVATNGTPRQRASALRTLATDQTVRALRAAQPPRARGARRRPSLLAIETQKQRAIFDARNTQAVPGALVRAEGGPPTDDTATDEAYDGLGATFDFYAQTLERNSIDDEGMPLNGTVHFAEDYDNAFWDGERMVFGDGDLFNRFTTALDVIGHELTHGVTEDEGQLIYFFQSGALNESMSDVFGSLVKQCVLGQTAEHADWLIGAELFAGTNLDGVALRSMKAPGTAFDDRILGKDPQPGHMRDYVRTFEDNGGVHINSGIPNHAFYLVATSLGGHAWERAGRIWYNTLRDAQVRPNTGFVRFARRTVAHATILFGDGSDEKQAVVDAWRQVGINLR